MNTRTARPLHLDYAGYAEPRAKPARRSGHALLQTGLKYLPHVLLAIILAALLLTAAVTGPGKPQPAQPIARMGMHA